MLPSISSPTSTCFVLRLARGEDGATAVEMRLFGIDHEAEADLVGHADAIGPKGMLGGDEIGVGDDQPRLDARTVERGVADGADAMHRTSP